MARRKSQKDYVREYLLEKKTITPKDALELCGSMRLAAIIHELRHDEGMNIVTHECSTKNRIGSISTYAKYILED